MTTPDPVEWSRNHFRILREGGTWGVPRSGMIFTKRAGQLVLTAMMPHMSEMPITPAQLDAQQRADFNIIKKNFGLAGVPVVDPSKLIKRGNGQ